MILKLMYTASGSGKEVLCGDEDRMLTLNDILEARDRISPYIERTPLKESHTLSNRLGAKVYLKLEMFQTTGAFKIRGAFNKMLSLSPEEKNRGVVAVSGGNHAQAVAYAASKLGIKATVFMARSTPENYIEATEHYGAQVVLTSDIAEAFKLAAERQAYGEVMIHPYADKQVMAGQGTIGLEILEDLPQVTDVIISIGGGGLISGVATAIKSQKPNVRIWGVETAGADSMSQALKAGHPIELPAITSIAKTLGAPSVSEDTLAITRKLVESITVVSDKEAFQALEFLLERAKVLTEPAASCTLAAAERLRSAFTPQSTLVLLLCGGNVSLADLCHYRQMFSVEDKKHRPQLEHHEISL